jgi:CO dehydrogenase maturation factor
VRVAFVGKGGVGKSTLAATFSRVLARRGRQVVAIDCDPMPGLSYGLGLPVCDVGIPPEAVIDQPDGPIDGRFGFIDRLDSVGAVERYAPRGADGVRLLSYGKLRGHAPTQFRCQAAFRHIAGALPVDRFDLVGDLPAGTRQAFFGWARFADTVIVVTDPSMKAIHTARRLARLSDATWAPRRLLAVVNRVVEPDDVRRVEELTGLTVVASMAHDDAVALGDRQWSAPLDFAPDGAFVTAVSQIVDLLWAEEVTV